jgi:hypothetical protein
VHPGFLHELFPSAKPGPLFFQTTQSSLPAEPGGGFFLYSNFVSASIRSTKPVAIDTASATAERFSRVMPVLLTVGTENRCG